jgi:hypothetical protein
MNKWVFFVTSISFLLLQYHPVLADRIESEQLPFDVVAHHAGIPRPISGPFVNTIGYEDGSVISPDGEYLFIQAGPWGFTAATNINKICPTFRLAIGYNLNDCDENPNSLLIREVKGHITAPIRPDFPQGAFVKGKIRHLPGAQIPLIANGLATFPTVFYGFKRKSDGEFEAPFKVAFNDDKAVSAPFGLSVTKSKNGLIFLMAWDNYFNNLGDDKPDIYYGELVPGQNFNLGVVTYGLEFSGDMFSSIKPNVKPIPFTSHKGGQGNPHLFPGSDVLPVSIWTDDEEKKQDIALYIIRSGKFPNGKWEEIKLPPSINTSEHERQPFFDGEHLYMMRGLGIIRHKFLINGHPTCKTSLSQASCWGPEEILLGVNSIKTSAGSILAAGEPSVAHRDGKKLLYFTYVYVLDQQRFNGYVEADANVGWMELDKPFIPASIQ